MTEVDETPPKRCFIVMPFGRDPDEQRWFAGWLKAVIEPAVLAAGYEPVLSAAEDQPGAINDEIRTHLVFDEMVVADLAGRTSADPPNPNVMYELGIRHAFGLPVVLMGWEGQALPFDVNNQRAILSARDFLDIEPTKQRLTKFIRAAEEGKFYDPMKAVGRDATIRTESAALGEESLLKALAEEISDLKQAVKRSAAPHREVNRKPLRVKSIIGKPIRSAIYPKLSATGYNTATWSKFLSIAISLDDRVEMEMWGEAEWMSFALRNLPLIKSIVKGGDSAIDEPMIVRVTSILPPQPWPTDTHKDIADKLEITPSQASKCIQELIRRGAFKPQHNGVVVEDSAALETAED